jgi:predicted O-linked N-acetylglucosamine transferase (SPINDLY family)
MTTTLDSLIEQTMQWLRSGAGAQAIAAIETAPAVQRNTQVMQRLLATAHAQAGTLDEAHAAITRALAFTPIEPATRALAGRIALDLKQPANAFVQFEALVQIAPQQMAFWRYLCESATTMQTARRALQLVEKQRLDACVDVDVASFIVRALLAADRVNDAILLAETTANRHSQSSRARWLWVKCVVEEAPLTALASLNAASLPPLPLLDADAVDAALWLPEQFANDDDVAAWRERYGAGLHALVASLAGASLDDDTRRKLVRHSAFHLAYHGKNDLALQRVRGDALCALMAPISKKFAVTAHKAHAKIRVGFVSKHIRDCTVGHYFKHFFTDLADTQIAVHIYALGAADVFTDEVETHVDQLTVFADDDGAFNAITAAVVGDEIDVLIYPEIGMDASIEKLAALRLAPLQCALWGHPVTTGLPTIDVFLSARDLEPAYAENHYRERLQLLPNLGTCYPMPPAPSAASRTELGLPAQGLLVVCAQSPFKWSPNFTRAVAEILAQTPAATLVVFNSPDPNPDRNARRSRAFDGYLAQGFSPLGVDLKSRVIRLPQQTRTDFIAVLAACDLGLDTFGFSGGNTSLDALSVGLPVLTLPGEFMRGRQTFAMLKTLQLSACDALIASDERDYVDRAATLLERASNRVEIRAAITANAHKLFNDPAPVAALRAWLMQQ